ncbi:MAG: triose-phosphate isomerase [Candidatus Magasanikbacteria bacterium RIFCSPHIGHO2_01_FULL_50_8]|uniref:Triosephosphate isomerase n=2 Tax=Candidatus Magasanikiibacteriota TaxID=1752731 RepID=A0A1F6LMJ9_9BACT|nr:MAG: triose-phosphate isomerase [Candidatus Magasanikbacteria bacterium RIFCSPHIGHO2_01_FULL_50_8]OGH68256.1 MAG: triose-phosphate isomerase [Candidatus Magasanikbacteria bacterium RIFCSPHIGHO2_02_FULL_50_9b]
MKRYIVANWKLYLSVAKSVQLAQQLVRFERAQKIGRDVEVILAPSMLALSAVALVLKQARSKIKIAAQDCWIADEGAFTGATSPRELRRAGASFVLIGHSERRQHGGEDDALLAKKVAAARAAGLKIIFCVGETKEERNAGRAHSIVRGQVRGVKSEIDLLAYEPRWAIGTGLPIEPHEAAQMHEVLAKEAGNDVPICYGGSVSEKNVAQFLSLPHTNGVLIGTASSTYASLTAIISNARKLSERSLV